MQTKHSRWISENYRAKEKCFVQAIEAVGKIMAVFHVRRIKLGKIFSCWILKF
jgi:hypothetical protein